MEFHGLLMRQAAVLARAQLQESEANLFRATELASTTRHPRLVWQTHLVQAARALMRGDIRRSKELSNQAASAGRRVHDPSTDHLATLQAFQLARFSNDWSGWAEAAQTQIERFPSVPHYRAGQALIYCRVGQLKLAEQILEYFASTTFDLGPLNSLSLWTFGVLAETAVRVGKRSYAVLLYELLLPYCDQVILAGWGAIIDGAASHYLGMLASLMSQPSDSRRHFESALYTNRRLNAPLLIARTEFEYVRSMEVSDCDLDGRTRDEMMASARRTMSSLVDMARHPYAEAPSETDTGMLPMHSSEGGSSRNVLKRLGDSWRLRYDGTEIHVRHSVGMMYLATIIAANGAELHVIDLISGSAGASANGRSGDLTSVLDNRARAEYRTRISDLDLELEDARAQNNIGGISRLLRERESIVDELKSAYGLAGRGRMFQSEVDRARVSVRNRLTSALNAIRPYHQAAWRHLSVSLRTGRTCSYAPERVTLWDLD